MTYNACQSLPHREKLNTKFECKKLKVFDHVSLSRYTYIPYYIVSREPTSRAHSGR